MDDYGDRLDIAVHMAMISVRAAVLETLEAATSRGATLQNVERDDVNQLVRNRVAHLLFDENVVCRRFTAEEVNGGLTRQLGSIQRYDPVIAPPPMAGTPIAIPVEGGLGVARRSHPRELFSTDEEFYHDSEDGASPDDDVHHEAVVTIDVVSIGDEEYPIDLTTRS